MKKLFITLTAIGLLTLSASAVDHRATSFLNARSVTSTNAIGVTNLASVTAVASTNVVGLVYTNTAGTRVVAAAGNTVNLLKTAPLWSPGLVLTPTYTNQAPGAARMPGPYIGGIYIRMKGGSGANSAVTFVFAPVFSDSGADATIAANLITVALTATTTTEVQSYTLVDWTKVIGAKGLMLRSITNADTDAASNVEVLECSLVGFVP